MSLRKSPLIYTVHKLNHTETVRVGSVSSIHAEDSDMVTNLGVITLGEAIYNCNPGLYIVRIDNQRYAFDLYEALSGSDYMIINSATEAYAISGMEKIPLLLYKLYSNHSTSTSYALSSTVNDAFDMIMIDGYTSLKTILGNTTPSIKQPMELSPISTLSFNVTNNTTSIEDVDVELKYTLRSLPNEVNDTLILNAELQKYHIITRVGRTVFSGYDAWTILEDYSDTSWIVAFCSNSNVKIEDADDNLYCTHLPVVSSSTLLSSSCQKDCIAVCGDESLGNGFLMKIPYSYIDHDSTHEDIHYFSKWLNEIFLSGWPMILQYPLASYSYRSLLLEEYHVPTYYPNTVLTVNTDESCNVSYFYKSLSEVT